MSAHKSNSPKVEAWIKKFYREEPEQEAECYTKGSWEAWSIVRTETK
jgi:hypothetical protein